MAKYFFHNGFISTPIVILLVIISLASFITFKNIPFNQTPENNPPPSATSSAQPQTSPSSTSSKSISQTPTLTPKTSPTPTPSPTNSGHQTPSSTPTPTPSLTVTSPNGGETWTVGETKKISWEANNLKYIRIYIEDPGGFGSGSTNYIYDGVLPANQGYYDWKITQNQLPSGATLPRKYRLRIDGLNETTTGASVITRDYSNEPFNIIPIPPTPTSSTTKPVLTITGPYTIGESGPCFDLSSKHPYNYTQSANYKFDENESSYRYTSLRDDGYGGKATVCWIKDSSKIGKQYVFKAKSYVDISSVNPIYSDEVSLPYTHP